MKQAQDLKKKLQEIDHKGYKLYKELKGSYDMGNYVIAVDRVQGDPFATPSRVRVIVDNHSNFPAECWQTKERKIAVEDYILRSIHQFLGQAKRGKVTICPVGQEVLERIAVLLSETQIEVRLEIGFPAFGRTIAAGQLEQIFFKQLSELAAKTLVYKNQDQQKIKAVQQLADDQCFIRAELKRLGLTAFIADGAILPRQSGVSQKPMRDGKAFYAPESLAVTLQLPHHGILRGMGIRKGITLIAGGGYHGKSTLLKAIERGVYNHIAGDGREYVITDESAVKLRAEEGRNICQEDISMFISHLPSGEDTTVFSTENASGSTSQAANTIEAITVGSKLFLIDEDTSATNFMVRDETMAKLVPESSEPITPFIKCIQSIRDDLGISTILVVGSSGEYLSVADCVIQMDCYEAKDVTKRAVELATDYKGKKVSLTNALKRSVRSKELEKVKMHGWDTISADRTEIDLRYLDQIADAGQTAAMAYMLQYALAKIANGKKTPEKIADELYEQIKEKSFLSVVPSYYGTGAPVMPRKAEFLACLLRYRGI